MSFGSVRLAMLEFTKDHRAMEYHDMKPQLSNTPLVSIIICTRNRAADLALTLDSVSRLRTEIPYEVIVCDNGSTDITKDMVLSGHHLPEVVYLHEPHPGKSIAAN